MELKTDARTTGNLSVGPVALKAPGVVIPIASACVDGSKPRGSWKAHLDGISAGAVDGPMSLLYQL